MNSRNMAIGCFTLLSALWRGPRLIFRLLLRLFSLIRVPTKEDIIERVRTEDIKQPRKVEPKVEISIVEDECPEFQEIFDVDKDTIIGIERILRCPDETAILRIVNNDSFSKQFKRKVYTVKSDKFIKIDNKKLYITKASI